jgi:hypothetical protein
VVAESEIRVILPAVSRSFGDDTLDKAPVGKHALLDGKLQACEVQFALEEHDADNLHQIARSIHAQPRLVDVGDTLA